jgi:signal transduction histidine kinase
VSSGNLTQGTLPPNTWLHRWIYYLAASFIFAALAVRSLLIYQDSPLLAKILLLLLAWLAIFIGISLTGGRSSWFSGMLVGLEILIAVVLLLTTQADYFASLFAILAMQVMQLYKLQVVALLVGLSGLLTFFCLVRPNGGFQTTALTIIYTAASVFFAAYIWSARRARVIQDRQKALAGELREANRQLERYSQQMQQLAAGRERQRLARELHDSVTQTIFSMTLTTQSALILLERDRQQVVAQLDRMEQLAQNAMAEMQLLISKLAPEAQAGGGFVAALQQHVADRRRLEGLSVSLEVEGSQQPEVAEEASLFRIAQEALNNVVKHAGVLEAVLRLHLADPFWMELEDRGAGFDPQQVQGGSRMGLSSMHERAAEIGWDLRVSSAPGAGTRVRVEKGVKGI